MDAFVGLLDGPRAHDAFLLRSILDPPWSLRIRDEAPLTLVTIVHGDAWIIPNDGAPTQLHPGDSAIVRGPDHYTVADSPDTRPQVIIHPDQLCTTLDGHPLYEDMKLGVRTWGNSLEGSTTMLTGTYGMDGEVGRRLLDALPREIVVPADPAGSGLIELLAREITSEAPGQKAILDRMLDLVLMSVVRAWFARPEGEAPGWYAANGDPIVGPALRLIHNSPAHPWTVAELATAVGASRAAFARRFQEMITEPPMAYLTGWRLSLAADLLRDDDLTIAAVARQVGYGSPYALSSAFKRYHGVSPKQFRNAYTDATPVYAPTG